MDPSDHRNLGRELGIFATDDLLAAGMPLWLPAGGAIRGALERFIVDIEQRAGYAHVYSPEIAKRGLYERSGHWEHYHEEMYPPIRVGADELVLRPMNCPHHILMYQAAPRTRRDLPMRLAELGTMYRFERSGVVSGLSRVRRMTLNDGHVFCPPEAVPDELDAILGLVETAYRALGIPAPRYRLSLGGESEKYVREGGMWAVAESLLRGALESRQLDFFESVGDAAFYGPKIDIQVTDLDGHEETLSTVQVDFHLPGQFELEYRSGAERLRPVMIHRGLVSTMERMVAHLLETHRGALPAWLAPVHCAILPVVDDAVPYARLVHDQLQHAGIRVDLDDRDATLASRVRDARRVPYVAVVGRREMESQTISLRARDGRSAPSQSIAEVAAFIAGVDRSRSLDLFPAGGAPGGPV
jgi:threonyl-tRNA synthetase